MISNFTSEKISRRMKYDVKTFLFLLLIFITLTANGQKTSFSKVRMRDTKAQLYIDSAQYFTAVNPTKSFFYVEKALKISLENRDKSTEANCYKVLGDLNNNLGQYDLAINYYHKAENQYIINNDQPNLNKTYLLLGDACYLNKDYAASKKYYQLYQKYINKQGSTAQKIEIKNKLAGLYQGSGQTSKAIEEYSDVLEMEQQQNNSKGYVAAQNKLGESYEQSNQKTKALAAYKKSENVAKKTGDNEAVVSSLKKQSEVLRSNEAYDDELKVRNEIIQISEKTQDKKVLSEENLEIGNILVKKDQAKEALPYIQKSIRLANETGNLEQKGKALQSLSFAYSSNAEYNKALEVYKIYVDTKDALHRQKENEIKQSYNLLASLNRQIQRLDLIEKELQISEETVDLLKQEQAVNVRSLKAQKILTISMITALLVVTLASIWIFRSNLQKRRANQMLALKSLRSQMNPHFIYNSLNSVNNYISKSDEKSANKFLSDFSRLMRAVMDNSKHDFVPLSSEIQILDVYLKLEQSRFSDKFDYQFNIDPDLETEQYQVPPMLIQPFIENAIWHGLRYRSDKGMLTVNLSKEKSSVKVTIEDNGIGRKKSEELKTKNQKEHASTGLKNIETRISIINQLYRAKIGLSITDLDSHSETGTRVILTIPVKNESYIAQS
jgi:tetratricopeptide (TPR) repeat protein